MQQRRWIELGNLVAQDPLLNRPVWLAESFRVFGRRNPQRYGITPPPPLIVPPRIMPSGMAPPGSAVSGVPNLKPPMGPGQDAGNAAGLQIRGPTDGMPKGQATSAQNR